MRYDGTGVDASGGYQIINKPGWYPFRISVTEESKSKNGNYMVIVDCLCLAPEFRDIPVRHWVTFLPKENKGAGIALHFLKSIGEPHEGVIDINPMRWERKTFMGKVTINEYQGKDGTIKRNNKFEAVDAIKEDMQATGTDDKAPWD